MKSLKNILKVPFYLVISILLVSLVNADFTVDAQANLGGTSQDRGVSTSTTITITNTNTLNSLDSVTSTFTTTKTGYSNNDFNISVTGIASPITVAANGSTTLTINGYIPLRFDSGQHLIGNLVISGVSNSTTFQKTVPVYVSAISRLDISRVELDVNGDSNRISDGRTTKVNRGDSIGVTTTVENLFSTSSDIEISDITVYVTNNGLDIDEEDSIGTLSPRDDDSITLSFDITDDADDRSETVDILVEGTDDNGAVHTATFSFDLDVQVERYDLKINDISTTPSSVCPGQTINAKILLENSGVRDLTHAQVYLSADDINFAKKITEINLYSGDSKTLTESLQVPSTLTPGTYILDVKTYYDASSGSLIDEQSGSIVVKNCQATTSGTQTTTGGQTTTDQTTGTSAFQLQQTDVLAAQNAVFATPVTKKSSSLFGSSDTYLLVLVFTNVLILILLLVILLVGKRYY